MEYTLISKIFERTMHSHLLKSPLNTLDDSQRSWYRFSENLKFFFSFAVLTATAMQSFLCNVCLPHTMSCLGPWPPCDSFGICLKGHSGKICRRKKLVTSAGFRMLKDKQTRWRSHCRSQSESPKGLHIKLGACKAWWVKE